MISPQLAARIKELELHTRRILSSSGIGAVKSLQKGFGLDFDQLRNYQYGDDVRLIDWKSSTRSGGTLYVRQYLEERNRTFIVCLDISKSTLFGSGNYSKHEIMQQISGILSLAPSFNKDNVGLILFSDQIELFIQPSRGQHHVHRILEKIFSHQAQGIKTDFNVLCKYIAQYIDKKSTLLVVSDFITTDFTAQLKKIINHRNFIAISCLDGQEEQLPDIGLVFMQDPETGQRVLVNSKGGKQSALSHVLKQRVQDQKLALQSLGVSVLMIKNMQTCMHDLITFFKKNMAY